MKKQCEEWRSHEWEEWQTREGEKTDRSLREFHHFFLSPHWIPFCFTSFSYVLRFTITTTILWRRVSSISSLSLQDITCQKREEEKWGKRGREMQACDESWRKEWHVITGTASELVHIPSGENRTPSYTTLITHIAVTWSAFWSVFLLFH